MNDWEKNLFDDIQELLFNIEKIIVNKKYYQDRYDKMFGYPIEYKDIDEDYIIIKEKK